MELLPPSVIKADPEAAPASDGASRPAAEPRSALGDGLTCGAPIRVCFLIDRLGFGGTELQLLALLRALDRSLVAPHLCLLDGSDPRSRSLEPPDCPVLRLRVSRLSQPWAPLRLARFVRFLRRLRAQVLQLYFPDSTCFGLLAGRLARVPCIIRTRNNAHRSESRLQRGAERILGRFATLTLANSEAARQAAVDQDRADPLSVVVIPNGVDLERFAHIRLPEPQTDVAQPRKVGMVANLRTVKGVDVFVRAAALVKERHPDVSFHVCGEGPERPALASLVGGLGLSGSFHLDGTGADIPSFLAGLDVAVLSSRSEGMPNAVLEYMAAARPIVATRIPGVVAVLTDEREALLAEPDSPPSLAAAILRLLENRPLAARLAAAARARAEAKFSVTARAQTVYRLWCRSLGASGHH